MTVYPVHTYPGSMRPESRKCRHGDTCVSKMSTLLMHGMAIASEMIDQKNIRENQI